jgi:simple sugar transport system permease protein
MKIQVIKRKNSSTLFKIMSPILSVLLSLIVVALFLYLVGVNPLTAYKEIIEESIGSGYGLSETLVKTTPMILCGLGVAIAFRMNLWNIGAEGQLYMGAIAATWVALFSGIENHAILIVLMFLVGATAGGLWAAFAGFFKAKFNVNEVIVTLMMNYIAILFSNFLIYGPWKDPNGFNFPLTAQFSEAGQLTQFFDTRLHSGFILAVICVFVVFLMVEKTVWGYEIKVVGDNAEAAKYAGMNIKKNIILVLFLSGALAGIAGFSEVAGVQHRLQHGLSTGYGYTAIIIAWLAKRSAFGVLLVSFLMGILMVGGDALQIYHQLPVSMVFVFQGLILFFLLASEFFILNIVKIKRS